ncbi:hypothetical protein [Carboxylicivirga sp. N1Y90]|uniref:hypothetical protein n=1 Tax=Carboxylicivirga fragile TaxID=3417571 RepID=UPI003D3251A0|nr:hypothetical protein [Marinilabiliaceae bacterium N1Y90]
MKLNKAKHIVIITMCFFVFCTSCTQKSNTNSSVIEENILSGELLADTIIYSVVIKNRDSLDQWAEKSLSKLNRKRMVDQIFESVYEHQAEAYDYVTEAPMSVSDVKAIEDKEDFSRDKVAKLQFWEAWYYDEEQVVMSKKVLSVLVAYEATTDDGDLLGYKAAFYIKTK